MNYTLPGLTPDTVSATFITDEQSAHRVAARVTDAFGAADVAIGLADTGHGRWRVTFYFPGAIDQATARELAIAAVGAKKGRALRFQRLAAKDWVADSLKELKPIAAGRFVVHGGHDRGGVPANRIGIEIEAALAFGTGHHGTTRGCLIALEAICKLLNNEARKRASPSPWKGESRGGGHPIRGLHATPTRLAFARHSPPFRGRSSRILDLGTGTGVLALAAARGLRRRVLATDIDPQAVRIARWNARLNRCATLVHVCRGNGLAAPDIRARAPFDLIFANILLAPLQQLAAPLRKIIAPRGRVVLSGLLKSQANAALAAYRTFTLERRIELDGWTTLVLRRPAAVVRHSARS
jgi:ribosomal protein L11 methyltransferase